MKLKLIRVLFFVSIKLFVKKKKNERKRKRHQKNKETNPDLCKKYKNALSYSVTGSNTGHNNGKHVGCWGKNSVEDRWDRSEDFKTYKSVICKHRPCHDLIRRRPKLSENIFTLFITPVISFRFLIFRRKTRAKKKKPPKRHRQNWDKMITTEN